MGLFFRRPAIAFDPLPISMSGVRLGERVLQIGVDDATLAGQLAARTGLSGSAAHIVTDEAAAGRVRNGAAQAGVLVDVRVAPLDAVPFEADAFDLVVVHSASGLLAALDPALRAGALREYRRVLRPGGRVIVVEAGTPAGLTSFLRSVPAPQAAYDQAGGTTAALAQAGFSPVRLLGDREGQKFSEGLRG